MVLAAFKFDNQGLTRLILRLFKDEMHYLPSILPINLIQYGQKVQNTHGQ